jgi:dATP pyrophosphohydrolase
MLKNTEIPPIRYAIGVVIVDIDQHRYLILRRNPKRYKGWGLVKGGIDGQETPEQACAREIGEEIGVHVPIESLIDVAHQSAYFDNTKSIIVLVRWFAVHIAMQTPLVLEVDEWAESRWATYDEAQYELVWQSQQYALRVASSQPFLKNELV